MTDPIFSTGTANHWLSCQYGPTNTTVINIAIKVLLNGELNTLSNSWNPGNCTSQIWDCVSNGGGLYRIGLNFQEDQAWNTVSVVDCQILLTGDSQPHPCLVVTASGQVRGFPPFPDHWWPGGSDANASLLGACRSGHAACTVALVAEPVNTLLGNYYSAVTDARLPGIGIPFAFTRSYNSRDPASGPIGVGWTHSYNSYLAFKGNGDAVLHAERWSTIDLRPAGGRVVPGG